MKNSLNREVLFNPYQGIKLVQYQTFNTKKRPSLIKKDKIHYDLKSFIQNLDIKDGMTISFHHHLRNGDYVLNMVMEEIANKGVKNLTLCMSSIFPIHQPLVEMFEKNIVTKVITSYVNGPVARAISEGKLKGFCIMQTHGYRASAIMNGEVKIDYAFIAAPGCSSNGDLTGSEGPSSCGVLGYAIADAFFGDKVIAITDYITPVSKPEIPGYCVDAIIKVDKIGDPKGIVSGTTKITRDPVGLKIAKMTAELMKATGLLKDGFTFQTGAGGISLAVAKEVKDICLKEKIKGRFASGGTTSYLVNMLEEGIFENLYDVQCFELDAVKSVSSNPKHLKMSASEYADIYNKDNIVNQLDFVILGATEIDLDFNVNVTTGSDGLIIGGSGGHADTAYGAKLSIIVSKLVSSRISVVCDKVTTITTPGETVDILVTDRGIAINPKHQELIEKLKKSTSLPIVDMPTLLEIAQNLTGVPDKIETTNKVVALCQYRDGTIIDQIYQIKED